MDITKVSIIHHIALVLLVLWILASLGCRHPIVFFLSLLYLYAVNESYSLRLRRRLQYEERKYASQRRLLSDSESVRWLNHAIEKIWPICMEQIASQQLLMPIIPWFLDKFKPWTAKKAVVQHLYLGRSPPMVTEIRVLGESTDDDHLVLELGMSFLSANDMSAILEVQLRKRLGLGIRAKMHVTGMHVEGKVLVGVKFLRHWPFLGRVRVCFVEPPYFQMTVKPILPHGVDVTELPGIAGWLDNILAVAFEQTLVEPNMLVVDVEKFVSSPEGNWFNVDEKPPIAFVKLEIIEAADMNPSDMNGLADPYVKGHLGPYRFRTKVQKKTLAPKWLEEFRIPICSWEAPNVLVLGVLDKDLTYDDMMGDCSINISDLRGGKRHEKWWTLQNIKKGRMLLAITVLEDEIEKEKVTVHVGEEPSRTPGTTSPDSGSVTQDHHEADAPLEKRPKEADEFEPISIEGKEKTSIWVHHPGSEVPQTWEPKKGRTRRPEIQLRMEDADGLDSPRSSSGSHRSDASSFNDFADGSKARRRGLVSRGLHKIGSFLNKSPRNHSPRYQSPRRRGDMGDQEGSLSSLGDRDDNFKTLLSRKLENLEQVEQGKGSEIGVMEKGERPDSSNRSSVDELKPAFVKESINGNTKIGSDSSSIGDSKEPKSDEAKVLIEGR